MNKKYIRVQTYKFLIKNILLFFFLQVTNYVDHSFFIFGASIWNASASRNPMMRDILNFKLVKVGLKDWNKHVFENVFFFSQIQELKVGEDDF